ncbi:hypothetical protein LWI28_020960 [Acer negundo]|uniref:Uncharacterized protein n=1 Tax=Acer negundo TaxID=4023 RepID=A0AAD5IMJ6_ACENE|nr:hypothetical protein LWI28_020960 [Acer negundo]
MVSPSMLGLIENLMVFKATLCSSSHASVPICGEGSVSGNGGLRLGNVFPILCDIPISIEDSIQDHVLNSNHVSMGGKSYADLFHLSFSLLDHRMVCEKADDDDLTMIINFVLCFDDDDIEVLYAELLLLLSVQADMNDLLIYIDDIDGG